MSRFAFGHRVTTAADFCAWLLIGAAATAAAMAIAALAFALAAGWPL